MVGIFFSISPSTISLFISLVDRVHINLLLWHLFTLQTRATPKRHFYSSHNLCLRDLFTEWENRWEERVENDKQGKGPMAEDSQQFSPPVEGGGRLFQLIINTES